MSDSAHVQRRHRHVNLREAVWLFFKNYFNFNGRTSRRAFWWGLLFISGLWAGTLLFAVGLLFFVTQKLSSIDVNFWNFISSLTNAQCSGVNDSGEYLLYCDLNYFCQGFYIRLPASWAMLFLSSNTRNTYSAYVTCCATPA